MVWFYERSSYIDWPRIEELMVRAVEEARERICRHPKRVLLLPPDITRMHSGAGRMTEIIYQILSRDADVHVIPTLGQHEPHSREQNARMFGSIPHERIHAHHWINTVVRLGEVPANFVEQVTHGAANWAIPIELNSMLMQEPWDLVINIGHVVPHEVLGFANHNKNYFIGLAGKGTICASHIAAACCGIENNLGTLITPVRACYNNAENEFLGSLPDFYIQIVMARDPEDRLVHTGIYVGDDLETYLMAARQSREENIKVFEEPLQKVVCVMQEDEFVSTWVANKAIYRTRMAMADGGELIIIAPGLKRFGEQEEVDRVIRKYGYVGTQRVMELYRQNQDLQELAHATAHLIHGSSEGRFRITYAPGHLTKEEIEGVNFGYADLQETLRRYPPDKMREGWNTTPDGETIYFIPTPSAGLWATRKKLYERPAGYEC